MSVQVNIISKLEITELLTVLGASAPAVTIDSFTTRKSLSALTTVPATKQACFSKALSSGAGTIDFTSLVGINGAAVTATGLKLQAAKFQNPSTNANDITIVGGASNGYLLFGAAGSLVLKPGCEALLLFADNLPDVGGSAKTIDLSGTGAQTLSVQLVFG